MMQTLVILLIGFVSGFCSSAPLGPINMWLVDLTLRETSLKRRAVPFLSGVIIVDVAFALLAVWGYGELLHEALPSNIIAITGACFLILLGLLNIRSLLSVPNASQAFTSQFSSRPPQQNCLKELSLGMSLCGSNPAFLLFWVYVANQIASKLSFELGLMTSLAMACGIILGDVCWFRTLIFLVKKGQAKMGRGFIFKARVGIAIAFIITGILGLWQND